MPTIPGMDYQADLRHLKEGSSGDARSGIFMLCNTFKTASLSKVTNILKRMSEVSAG